MKRFVVLCVVALAAARASFPLTASAQEPLDPLIIPLEGGRGSRFQIVGQFGWTPGEQVRIRLAYTSTDPLTYPGPFPVEHTTTVLRDATWSFPVVLTDDLFATPLPDPGYIVVQAQSRSKTAQNAYIYSPNGRRPAGAEVIAALGFGLSTTPPVFALTASLFALATGALFVLSGASRVLSSKE